MMMMIMMMLSRRAVTTVESALAGHGRPVMRDLLTRTTSVLGHTTRGAVRGAGMAARGSGRVLRGTGQMAGLAADHIFNIADTGRNIVTKYYDEHMRANEQRAQEAQYWNETRYMGQERQAPDAYVQAQYARMAELSLEDQAIPSKSIRNEVVSLGISLCFTWYLEL